MFVCVQNKSNGPTVAFWNLRTSQRRVWISNAAFGFSKSGNEFVIGCSVYVKMDLLAKAAESKNGGNESEGSPSRSSGDRSKRAEPTPFIMKLYELVSDPSTDDLCAWTDTGDAFVVLEPGRFTSEILPRYFKHHNFSSFVRQLNQYAFNKCSCVRLEYRNPNFRRGRYDLLALIERRPNRRPTPPSLSGVGSDTAGASSSGGSPKKVRLPSPPPTAPPQEMASSWPGSGYNPWRPTQLGWTPYHGRSGEAISSSGNVCWTMPFQQPGAYVGHAQTGFVARPETPIGRDPSHDLYSRRRRFSPELLAKGPAWPHTGDIPANTSQNLAIEGTAYTVSKDDVRRAEQWPTIRSQLSVSDRAEKSPASALIAALRQRLEAEKTEYVHINTVLSLVADIEAQQERELLGICTETMHIVDRFRSHLLAFCARRCGRACEFAMGAALSAGGRSTNTSNPPSGETDSPVEHAASTTTTDAQAASPSAPGSSSQGMMLDEQLPDI
jgi:hypothetical protein